MYFACQELFGDVRVLYAGDLNGRPYFLRFVLAKAKTVYYNK